MSPSLGSSASHSAPEISSVILPFTDACLNEIEVKIFLKPGAMRLLVK